MKISGVYKITNTVTGDFYIGSSKDVKHRWACHKCPSRWNEHPNNPLYKDMKKYSLDKFIFEILEEVKPEYLKEAEQKFIETLKPTYNSIRANGWDVDKYKESHRKANKKYNKKYYNQLCCYNDKTLTLNALASRFKRAGVEHPAIEAKKYLIKKGSKESKEPIDCNELKTLGIKKYKEMYLQNI